ncbi:MAG: hypothetical protein ACP5MW_00615 [Thermoplasmata archaeon]
MADSPQSSEESKNKSYLDRFEELQNQFNLQINEIKNFISTVYEKQSFFEKSLTDLENEKNKIQQKIKENEDIEHRLQEGEKYLEERENNIIKKEKELNNKENALTAKEKELFDKEISLKKMEKELDEQKQRIIQMQEELDRKGQDYSSKENELLQLESQLKSLKEKFNQKEAELLKQEEDLIQKRKSLLEREKELSIREQEISKINQGIYPKVEEKDIKEPKLNLPKPKPVVQAQPPKIEVKEEIPVSTNVQEKDETNDYDKELMELFTEVQKLQEKAISIGIAQDVLSSAQQLKDQAAKASTEYEAINLLAGAKEILSKNIQKRSLYSSKEDEEMAEEAVKELWSKAASSPVQESSQQSTQQYTIPQPTQRVQKDQPKPKDKEISCPVCGSTDYVIDSAGIGYCRSCGFRSTSPKSPPHSLDSKTSIFDKSKKRIIGK